MTGRIAILGVGHLASTLVPGLLRRWAAKDLLLSPRNAQQAAVLAERHGIEIARDNHDLVTRAGLVMIATRPDQAIGAIAGLPWRADQVVISLCAGLATQSLAPLVDPAALRRAMPITAAMIGQSPTCLYPDCPQARVVLKPLGPILALPDEAAFEAASVSAAYYGWIHALIGEISDWTAAAGMPRELARELVARTTAAAAEMVAAAPGQRIEDLVAGLATPGGITELGLSRLEEARAFEDWRAACDAVLEGLRTPERR